MERRSFALIVGVCLVVGLVIFVYHVRERGEGVNVQIPFRRNVSGLMAGLDLMLNSNQCGALRAGKGPLFDVTGELSQPGGMIYLHITPNLSERTVSSVVKNCRHLWEVEADAVGRFVFEGIPSGQYVLSIPVAEGRAIEPEVRVQEMSEGGYRSRVVLQSRTDEYLVLAFEISREAMPPS